MNLLRKSMDTLRANLLLQSENSGSCIGSDSTRALDCTDTDSEDFAFTYEEEAVPEVFFLPYVWEVLVCAITSGSLEWDKAKISIFQLLKVLPESSQGDQAIIGSSNDEHIGVAAQADASEMV